MNYTFTVPAITEPALCDCCGQPYTRTLKRQRFCTQDCSASWHDAKSKGGGAEMARMILARRIAGRLAKEVALVIKE